MILAQLKRKLKSLDLGGFVLLLLRMMLLTQVAALVRPSSHPLYFLAHGILILTLLVLSIWWGRLPHQKRHLYLTRVASLSEQSVVSITVILFILAMGTSAYFRLTKPSNLLHPSATYLCIVSSAVALAIIRNLRMQVYSDDKWWRKRSTWIVSLLLLMMATPFQILLWWSHGLPQGDQWIMHLDAEGYVYYAYQILGIVGPQPPTFLVRPPGYPLLVAFFLAIVGETEIWMLALINAIMLGFIPAIIGLIMCRFVRPILALLIGLLALGHEISWSYLVLGSWRATTFLFVTVIAILAIASYTEKDGYQRRNLLVVALLVAIRALVRLHGTSLVLILSAGILICVNKPLTERMKQVATIAILTILPLLLLYAYHGVVFGSPGLSLESVTTMLDNFPTEEGVENPDTAEMRYVHSFLTEADFSDFFRVDMGYDLMFMRAYQVGIPYSEFAKTANQVGWQIIAANLTDYVRFSSKNLLFHLFYPGFGKHFFNFHDVEYPPNWDNPRIKCLPDFLHVGTVTNTTCDEWEQALGKMERRPEWYTDSTGRTLEAKDQILSIVQSMFGIRNYFKGIIGLLGSIILLTQKRTRFIGFLIGSMLLAEIVPHAAFAPTQPRYTYVPQFLSLIASFMSAAVLIDLASRKWHRQHDMSRPN